MTRGRPFVSILVTVCLLGAASVCLPLSMATGDRLSTRLASGFVSKGEVYNSIEFCQVDNFLLWNHNVSTGSYMNIKVDLEWVKQRLDKLNQWESIFCFDRLRNFNGKNWISLK